MQGQAEESITLFKKARDIGGDQDPHWLARLNMMEAQQQLIIGDLKRAKNLQNKARKYYATSGLPISETMQRTDAYIAFYEGRVNDGIIQLETSWLNIIQSKAIERDESFNVIRGLAEQEKRAYMAAKENLAAFRISSIILGIIVIAFMILAKRQYSLFKELKRSKVRLEHIARTDGLTQLNNRRHWEECLEQEYSLLKRNPNRISSMIIFDIDYFKKVNDNFGHSAGDEVIKHVGELLRKNIRKTDVGGRFGGEEFAALLIDTALEDAVIVAETIREAIKSTHIDYDGHTIQVTVSLGVATYTPRLESHVNWIKQADNALYSAKDAGRNTSVAYNNNEQ